MDPLKALTLVLHIFFKKKSDLVVWMDGRLVLADQV